MTVNGVSQQSAALLQMLGGKQSYTGSQSYSGSSQQQTTTKSGNEAYQLSLGKQQINNGLIGYSQLGKLVRQTDGKVTDVARQNLSPLNLSTGDGQHPMRSFTVDVTQLAQGQRLLSQGVTDENKTSIGTGALTVSATDGATYDLKITDGTLDGIAKTINEAEIGITAKVVLGKDGQFRLELTGPNGAENSFKLSGIAALAFDPKDKTKSGAMTLEQEAKDAIYSISGGKSETSPGNTIMTKDGTPLTLYATGTNSFKVPFGLNRVVEASQTLADSLNELMTNIDDLTASDGLLSASGTVAKNLKSQTLAALQQNFAGTNLASVGVTSLKDGSIAVDVEKLQEAYADNPEAVRSALAKFAQAVHEALTSSGEGSIDKQVASFTGQLTQKLSLMDFLSSDDGSQSSGADFTSVLNTQYTQGQQSDNLSSLLLANFNSSLYKTT